MHALRLLRQARFWPLFWTQFLGAFNDNLFKNALVIILTFRAATLPGFNPEQMVALCGLLLILPYFLFSATAGQLADRFPKQRIVQATKAAEIGAMLLAAIGFWLDNIVFLLIVLFLMGVHSAFFGPVKLGVLPELLGAEDLVAGNALVETGTFLAILFGTILGGSLISMGGEGPMVVSVFVLLIAVLGLWISFYFPALPAEAPGLRIRWNPLSVTSEILQHSWRSRPVFMAILGLSWFWFLVGALLSLFPSYCKDALHGEPDLITFFLAAFSVGVGVGALLTDRLGKGRIELGLVPLGALGMTLFAADLFFAAPKNAQPPGSVGIIEFISGFAGQRITLDLFLLAVSGGIFIIPISTLIQVKTEPEYRSRAVAGSSIVSSFFMVLSSLLLMALYELGLTVVQLFLVLAALNLAVTLYAYWLIPEHTLRLYLAALCRIMFRVRVRGIEHIPATGPCVLVCNHVSFVDWIIIAAACPRPPRFVMYHSFYSLSLLRWILRQGKVIPIASVKESPKVLRAAFRQISRELEDGQVVCFFPEGRLPYTAEMTPFQTGIERIVERNPVPVVPMALRGLWGSYFSRCGGRACRGNPLRSLGCRVDLNIGPPVATDQIEVEKLQATVAALHDEAGADRRTTARLVPERQPG